MKKARGEKERGREPRKVDSTPAKAAYLERPEREGSRYRSEALSECVTNGPRLLDSMGSNSTTRNIRWKRPFFKKREQFLIQLTQASSLCPDPRRRHRQGRLKIGNVSFKQTVLAAAYWRHQFWHLFLSCHNFFFLFTCVYITHKCDGNKLIDHPLLSIWISFIFSFTNDILKPLSE